MSFAALRKAIDDIYWDGATTDDLDAIHAVIAATEEWARQVHARHDLGHQLGAWPNACALCEVFPKAKMATRRDSPTTETASNG